MTLSRFCKRASALLVSAVFGVAAAQGLNALSVAEPAKLTVPRTGAAEYKLRLEVKDGYHVNSNKPNDEYLIPIKLTWTDGPLEAGPVSYPTPKLENYPFSDKPLSVFDGTFELTTKFKAKAGAVSGMGTQQGKVRYQACNSKMCLPPKTVDIKVPVLVQ